MSTERDDLVPAQGSTQQVVATKTCASAHGWAFQMNQGTWKDSHQVQLDLCQVAALHKQLGEVLREQAKVKPACPRDPMLQD